MSSAFIRLHFCRVFRTCRSRRETSRKDTRKPTMYVGAECSTLDCVPLRVGKERRLQSVPVMEIQFCRRRGQRLC